MTLSPSLDSLRDALCGARSVLFTGPVDPDGDSIGACLALGRATEALSDAVVHIAGETNYRYDWMPGAASMRNDDELDEAYDLVVVMDGDRTRLTDRVAALFGAAATTALVDHHGSTDPSGYDVVVLDPASPSTCEMVHLMLERWDVGLDRDFATLLYTGIIFDTGGFRHENTQPATHRLAARLLEAGVNQSFITSKVLAERSPEGLRLLADVLQRVRFFLDGAVALGSVSIADTEHFGIASGDLEGVIDAMLYTKGVEVACLVVERGPEQVKLSFRSRTVVDVAALAKSIDPSGGGHVRAAGVMLCDTLSNVLDRLPGELAAAVKATR